MPEYEITFRLMDRDDLPKMRIRVYAPDRDTARQILQQERPNAVICGAPMEIRPGERPFRL
jgi:hypothetical protein